MVWILIGIAVLVIIGPALVLLPSKRQKEQMSLRRVAAARGITVELCSIDDPDPSGHLQDYTSSLGKALPRVIKCIAYKLARKRTDDWRRTPPVSWKLVRRTARKVNDAPPGWDWQDTDHATLPGHLRKALLDRVAKLPDDVIAVGEAGYMVSVYWRENGGTEALNHLCEFLESISEIRNNPAYHVDE